MYKHDVPIIEQHGWGSPEGLHDVIEFVLLTIRQPLHYLKAQRLDIQATGENSRFLFGHKRTGWRWALDHRDVLWAEARQIMDEGCSTLRRVGLIEHFMRVPGLGMVKAAFVAQCLGAGTACLDQHNVQRLGLPPTRFKTPAKMTDRLRRAKVTEYVEFCDETGGSEYWWNSWCQHVAGRRGSPLRTPEEVSSYHAEVVLLNAKQPQLLAA